MKLFKIMFFKKTSLNWLFILFYIKAQCINQEDLSGLVVLCAFIRCQCCSFPARGAPKGRMLHFVLVPLLSTWYSLSWCSLSEKNGLQPLVRNPKACQDSTNLNLVTKNRLHISQCTLENFWHNARSGRERMRNLLFCPLSGNPLKDCTLIATEVSHSRVHNPGRPRGYRRPRSRTDRSCVFSCRTFYHLRYFWGNSFTKPS